MEELDASDPTRIGPYALLGILGSGGMGRVYLGQDADGERVAVKVIHSDLARDPEFRRRFRREIGALRAVSGPGIAAILDADAEAPRPWLATEYVDGPSLHLVVTAGAGPLPVPAVRVLGAALARTLAGVHAENLVHRDIKPTNLLLTDAGPKLIDFGIARDLAASTITRTGLAVGTPQFMAPEQLESGRRTGTAADVFALGGLLVFAATGQGPFGAGTPAQLLYAVVHAAPSLRDVPAELRKLLARCLDKDPANRPTAARVAEELEQPAGDVDPGAAAELEAAAELGGAPHGPRRRRARHAAMVGAVAVATVMVASVALMDENASGTNTGDHSAKGGALPGGESSTSNSDLSTTPGTSGTGTSSTAGGRPGPTSPSGTGAVSGSGSAPSTPFGGGSASTSNTDGPSSGGGLSTSRRGPGPTASSQASGTHWTTAPTRPPTSQTPPPSRASSTPPAGGSAPAAVTGVAMHPNSQDGSTMAVIWNADPGATSYVVKSSLEFVGLPTTVTVSGTSTSITVVPAQPYCVQVQALNSYGASAWSPASPLCVQAMPGGWG